MSTAKEGVDVLVKGVPLQLSKQGEPEFVRNLKIEVDRIAF